MLQADGGGEEEVNAVLCVHLEVEDAARDALPLARDGRDVRGELLAVAFQLAHEQGPAQRGGLAVVVRPIVGDGALVQPEAPVVDAVAVGAPLHDADLGRPDGADDGVAWALFPS